MIKSKAIQVLSTFTEDEFRSFGKFINSPLHNSNKNIQKLYIYLKRYFPDFKNEKFTKQNLYSALFPSKEFRDGKTRELMSDLMKLEKSFLSYLAFIKQPLEADLCLINELYKRKLDSLFDTEADSIMATIKKNNLDEMIFKHLMDIYLVKIKNNLMHGKNELVFDDLISYRENLVNYSLICLLKTTHNLVVIQGKRAADLETNLANEFMNSIDFEKLFFNLEDKKDKSLIILKIYYYMMMVYTKEDPAYFFKSKHLFIKSFTKLTHDEKYELIVALSNCCQHMITLGNREFFKELFETYKIMVSKRIYSNQTSVYFSSSIFRNIVGAGIMQKAFDWAEKFIKDFEDKLDPEQKENLINLSKAVLAYNKKEYDYALSCLSKVKYNNFTFKIDVRTLSMRIYYDLGAYEEYISMSDSLRQILQNTKLVNNKRMLSLLNYTKYSRELFKAKLHKDKELLLKVKKEVSSESLVAYKEWILDKINELGQEI